MSARLRFQTVAVVTLLALLGATAALAKTATTGPGSRLDVYFIITDKQVKLAIYSLSDYAGQNELYMEPTSAVVRGDVAQINVVNRGKKAHGFVILGKKTKALKPGTKIHFNVALLRRGSFPYHATTAGEAKLIKGIFNVY